MAEKAVFLDRDNTLIEDPGYIKDPNQVKLLDGVPESLVELKTLGYKLVVVSNQSAVARGIVTEETLDEIHDRLQELLAEKGATLDRIYYCPYHPDGVVAKYRKESDWRKPNPGMLLAAAEQMDIDLGQSWMIGNSDSDIEAGSRAGCRTILLRPSSHPKQTDPQPSSAGPKPDCTSINMKEAVNIIKKCDGSRIEMKNQNQSAVQNHTQQPIEEVEEKPPAPEKPKLQTPAPQASVVAGEQQITGEKSEQLLGSILEQLRRMERAEMFGEFSIMRLLAGIVQILVLFCLLMAIWFLTSPTGRGNAVSVSLGFAAVLQLMSLTFYVMQGRK
jgi:D,D-heptose 1,7-bisphosphate phosphatase